MRAAQEVGPALFSLLIIAFSFLPVFAQPLTRERIRDAVLYGAAERLRPNLMTVSAIVMGLLPIMWSSGTGASVMKRIAAPMIGGMASATVLTLFILPVAYGLVLQRRAAKAPTASSVRPSTSSYST